MTPGRVVGERFEIEQAAGRGGMGSVFRARDAKSGARVALKILHAEMYEHAERFLREAQILAELRHPGIVSYVAHGEAPDCGLYLAMEWLEGEDLSQRLGRVPLTLGETLTLGRNVAGALGAAHARGVVHRDVKPSNLFLVRGRVDDVRVLDFGIAHVEQVAVTQTGAMLGTPGYIAPEQARGSRQVGPPADIFALGAVLFECLTGRPPFVAEHALGVLAKILFEEAPSVFELWPEVPTFLDTLIARMLAKDPAHRPPHAAALMAELAKAEEPSPSRLLSLPPVGRSLSPRSPSARPALTGKERRLVSVIFGGMDKRQAERPVEATVQLAPQRTDTDRLAKIAESFRGRFEQLVDGSIVVTLVGQGSATDQAAQAARCALALRSELPQAPLALATDRGVISDGRLPVGEAIDRAVRLLRLPRQSAPPSGASANADPPSPGIRLDEVTAGLIDTRFEVDGDESGLRLRCEKELAFTARTLLGKPTPCVGRERELALLFGLFEECVAEPMARAVVVTGPAGIGKSRVRSELLQRIRQRGEGAQVWTVRGDPMSQGSPFAMLGQALRRCIGIVEGETLVVRQQKVRARVARHFVADDASRVAEFIAEIAGAPFSSESSAQLSAARQNAMLMGDQMRRAWEELLAAESAEHPVVIVLEDLHWGDLPSVRFLDFALERLADRPLFVVALARPEVDDLFPGLWDGRKLEHMRLAELTRKGSEKLVRQVLGESVDSTAVERIVTQAAGNAFYLEELIRAVAAGAGDALPGTVLAMVQARLEALEPNLRRTLRAAAVFGQVFWDEGVDRLLGGPRRGIDSRAWLTDLVGQELISARSECKFPGRREYTFRHALVREGAYEMLTEQDRALGHRLAGAWLVDAGESDAIVLAEHFDRGGEPAKAVGWYRRAAEQALEGHDLGAVLSRSARGVALGLAARVSDDVLGALRVSEAAAHLWRGEVDDAGRSAADAMDRLPPGDLLWYRAATWAIVSESGQSMRLDRLSRWIAAAKSAQPAPGARGAQIVCLARGAITLTAAGQQGADDLLSQIEKLAGDRSGLDPATVADVERARAFRFLYAGDLVAALTAFEATICAAEEAHDRRTSCLIRCNLGFVYKQLGAFEHAEHELRLSLGMAEEMGLRNVSAAAIHNLGMVLGYLGRLAEAEEVEKKALDMYVRLGDKRLQGGSYCYLSIIALLGGDHARAEQHAASAADLLENSPPMRVCALSARARALIALGRSGEALGLARNAVELLDGLVRVEEGEAAARLAYAEALAATGDQAAASVAIAIARDRILARAVEMQRLDLKQSYLERVTDNARILELARTWCTPSAHVTSERPSSAPTVTG
jgi:serine/threonine protein kinase/tetratricopeptide (TPR) repeat protein